jgi:hypothetical protein
VTVGETQAFIAIAYDVFNNVIPEADMIWTTDVGSVNPIGLFTAQTTPGPGTVTATNGTISDSAIVDVVAGALNRIIVLPNLAIVTVGSSQLFIAIAYDVYDNIISGVGIDWTTDVGTVDATGFFTAQTTPGTGVVTATNGTIDNSATVTVIPGPVDHIIVTPDPTTLTVGQTHLFSATAYDEYNNLLPGVEFTWITDVGSVDATGLFMAKTMPGTGEVTAMNGTVNGTASVTVVVGDVDSIIVTPSPVTVTVGEFLQFTASAYDVYNNLITDETFLWTTNVGVVNTTGFFTAQTTPAIGLVTATSGAISGSADIDVVVGTMDYIVVTPGSISIMVNGVQEFNAEAFDTYNNLISGVGFDWTTDVGVVDAAGLYTAQSSPGAGTVTATNGTVSGSSSVVVVLLPIEHIEVAPDPVSVMAGGSLLFTATAYDEFYNVISGVNFIWTTDVGTVDATGFFSAQTYTEIGTVTATNGTVSGSAIVNITPGSIDLIVIVPDPATVVVGNTQMFIAVAFDMYRNVISGVGYDWTTDVGSIDGKGLFTAQLTSGSGTVTATNGSVNNSAVVFVISGLASTVVPPDPVGPIWALKDFPLPSLLVKIDDRLVTEFIIEVRGGQS